MHENLVTVTKDSAKRIYSTWPIHSDFAISRYPVTVGEFKRVVEGHSGDPADSDIVKTATWAEAIRYCNLLNRQSGLPPAYDESSGALIDEGGNVLDEILETHGFRAATGKVKGFRLPTLAEWECAAMGLGNPQGGFFLKMLARLGYISVLEYGMPRTPVALDRLDVNPIGLCGMLGIAGEWCTDNRVQDAARNRVCYWQDYFTNYNNDISYGVQTRVLGDTDTQRFRVVLGQTTG